MGHFSYLGDAASARDTNIGAGTITCNFDGVDKHRTEIGADVFIGSDYHAGRAGHDRRRCDTGAGSVVTRDVAAGRHGRRRPGRVIQRDSAERGATDEETGMMDGRLAGLHRQRAPAAGARRSCVSSRRRSAGLSSGSWRNGETRVKLEENVRGSDVFIIQSMCKPADHHLMELLLMIDAARRASAARITAVIPYYGYAKQEKKTAGREPISAKLVANLIVTAGADRVLTLDLHAPAIEGFFDIPVDHLRATPLLAERFKRIGCGRSRRRQPGCGGVARADDLPHALSARSLAIISKRHPEPDATEVLEMVGDVEGKMAVIVDDMISTGGTL